MSKKMKPEYEALTIYELHAIYGALKETFYTLIKIHEKPNLGHITRMMGDCRDAIDIKSEEMRLKYPTHWYDDSTTQELAEYSYLRDLIGDWDVKRCQEFINSVPIYRGQSASAKAIKAVHDRLNMLQLLGL